MARRYLPLRDKSADVPSPGDEFCIKLGIGSFLHSEHTKDHGAI